MLILHERILIFLTKSLKKIFIRKHCRYFFFVRASQPNLLKSPQKALIHINQPQQGPLEKCYIYLNRFLFPPRNVHIMNLLFRLHSVKLVLYIYTEYIHLLSNKMQYSRKHNLLFAKYLPGELNENHSTIQTRGPWKIIPA